VTDSHGLEPPSVDQCRTSSGAVPKGNHDLSGAVERNIRGSPEDSVGYGVMVELVTTGAPLPKKKTPGGMDGCWK
jgi:hypothetical protein